MINLRKATISERIRGWVYKFAFLTVAIVAVGISLVIYLTKNMGTLIDNATTIAVAGAGVAAFLFTMQGILLSVHKDNPFMIQVRKDGHYLIAIHKFCRFAEITFMAAFFPMLYMSNEREVLNILAVSACLMSLLLTIWSMYLMGKILVISEKHALD